MSITDITVVITSFKSDEKIINCLNSINNQCKVIVVENSDDLKIKNKIESKFDNVQCILSGKNLGYGKTNKFQHDAIGFNYRLPNISGAVGLAQLENINTISENSRYYISDISDYAYHKYKTFRLG